MQISIHIKCYIIEYIAVYLFAFTICFLNFIGINL